MFALVENFSFVSNFFFPDEKIIFLPGRKIFQQNRFFFLGGHVKVFFWGKKKFFLVEQFFFLWFEKYFFFSCGSKKCFLPYETFSIRDEIFSGLKIVLPWRKKFSSLFFFLHGPIFFSSGWKLFYLPGRYFSSGSKFASGSIIIFSYSPENLLSDIKYIFFWEDFLPDRKHFLPFTLLYCFGYFSSGSIFFFRVEFFFQVEIFPYDRKFFSVP